MTILLIETATSVCSVAVASGDAVSAVRCSSEPNAHSSRMAPFVESMLQQLALSPVDLDAVCVSGGPGSYTGLRIGVSYAKGLCYALHKPLLAVPTLQAMAEHYFLTHADYSGWVCPMLDARRMECYTALYRRAADGVEVVKPVSADIIETGIYDRYMDEGPVVYIGDGAAKTQQVLGLHPNAHYDTGFTVTAEALRPAAFRQLQQGLVVDVAYYEPYYLKDFVAKKSVVRGLR
ncbi:MAG: universal bacterial protein YeaZ [bacterium P3]|nr:MAG: universal bacterial protein YeaZ [bacterium P3]KWW42107.1 MAG: universal bacterial protein YeaZ [bacterium F083]